MHPAPQRRRRRAALRAAAAALLLLAGPAAAEDPVEPVPLEAEPHWPRGVGSPADVPEALTGEAPADEDVPREDEMLAERVREAFEDRPALRWLTVRAEDGVVELEGAVDSEATRGLATLEAAAVPGVRDVRNRIEVRPPPREQRERGPRAEQAEERP